MTTERRPLSAIVALVFALFVASTLAACATDSGRRGGLAPERVAALPPKVRESYDLFEFKCSRCHTLARPLNADITDFEHWRAYVTRMRRQSGSGISEADGEQILVFLRHLTEERIRTDAKKEGGDQP